MKLIDGFYVDSNNNKWDAQIYNEKTAKKASKSLINCEGCLDCRNCKNCSRCTNCVKCMYCHKCIHCENCKACSDCIKCVDCENCEMCKFCDDCIDCSRCSECSECKKCSDYYDHIGATMKNKGYKITEFDYKGNFLEWATWNIESFIKIVNEDLRSKGRNEFIVFVDDDYVDNELSNFDEDWDIDDEEYQINKDILIRHLNEVRGCYADYSKNNGTYIRLGTTFEEVVKSYCERINIGADFEIID